MNPDSTTVPSKVVVSSAPSNRFIDVGGDAARDLQDAVVGGPAVALIIVIDKHDREDGERKDHACNQQAQAYRDRLFGK